MSSNVINNSIRSRHGLQLGRAVLPAIISLLTGIRCASSDDIFGTRAQVPASPASSLRPGGIGG